MTPRTATAAFVLASSAALTAAADDTRIADIIPGSPMLVVGVPSWSDFTTSMSASGFGDFWRDDQIQGLIAELMEDPKQGFEEAMEEIGVDPEDVEQPKGLIAGALYLDGPIDLFGTPDFNFALYADYADSAEDMIDIVERILEQGEDEGEIVVREDSYGDAQLWIIEPKELPADEDDNDEDDWEDDWDDEPAMPWDSLTLALSDGVFILASDVEHLEQSIDALGGEDIDSIADNDLYTTSLAQHPDASEAWGVFVPGALLDTFVEAMEMSAPPGVDANKMLEILGVRDIQTISAAMSFGDPALLMQQSFAMLVPEKRGLVGLFDTEGGAFTPPAFISPDTASASRFSINFEGVLQVIRDAMAQLPEEMRAQPEAIFEGMIAPIAAPLLSSMGSDVWITQNYSMPFAPDSAKNLVIASTKDEGAMGDLLVNVPGMEGREFAGGMIYSNQMGADMGVEAPSIGLASGRVFIGLPDSIENAMRLAANPGAGSLADEPRFRKGAAWLDNRALGFMYSDMAQAYRWMKWSMDNMEQIQRAEFEQMGLEPEEIEEIMEFVAESQPEWVDKLPSEELIAEYFGDTFGQVQSTDDGFLWTSYWLRGNPE